MAQMNKELNKELVNLVWVAPKSGKRFEEECPLRVALWHLHDLKHDYEPCIMVSGIFLPDPDEDETFFYAALSAAKQGSVWLEEAHAFLSEKFVESFHGGCFSDEELDDWLEEEGGWEKALLQRIYEDVHGDDPVTGGEGYAIIRDPDVARICEEDGWAVEQLPGLDEDGCPRWKVSEKAEDEGMMFHCHTSEMSSGYNGRTAKFSVVRKSEVLVTSGEIEMSPEEWMTVAKEIRENPEDYAVSKVGFLVRRLGFIPFDRWDDSKWEFVHRTGFEYFEAGSWVVEEEGDFGYEAKKVWFKD